MFKYSCFIRKNTKELRDKLEVMGYDITLESLSTNCLSIGANTVFGFNTDSDLYHSNVPNIINCGTNEQAFLAIAAIRDDTDKGQWFTDGTNWEYCIEDKFSTHDINQCEGMCELDLMLRHKANPQEILEHFKNK